MAILKSCCCCCEYSVRKGSYASGIYTLVYFFLFALLTGNYCYHAVVALTSKRHTVTSLNFEAENSVVTKSPIVSTSVAPPTTTVGSIFTTLRNNETVLVGYNETLVDEPDGATPAGELALILVDFTCEILGFLFSILLIRGLQQEKKSYLIPWLIIVPLHTVIDAFTVINIVILHVTSPVNELQSDGMNFVTAITVFLDLILNLINVYVFLCVISQYQEYQAGRGTAAYLGLNWNPVSVHYETGGQDEGTGSVGGVNLAKNKNHNNRMNGTNPCFSASSVDQEKSDIWCEDLVLDKLESSSKNILKFNDNRIHLNNKKNNSNSQNRKKKMVGEVAVPERSPTVRFECGTDATNNYFGYGASPQTQKKSPARSPIKGNLKKNPFANHNKDEGMTMTTVSPTGRSGADEASDATTITVAIMESTLSDV